MLLHQFLTMHVHAFASAQHYALTPFVFFTKKTVKVDLNCRPLASIIILKNGPVEICLFLM